MDFVVWCHVWIFCYCLKQGFLHGEYDIISYCKINIYAKSKIMKSSRSHIETTTRDMLKKLSHTFQPSSSSSSTTTTTTTLKSGGESATTSRHHYPHSMINKFMDRRSHASKTADSKVSNNLQEGGFMMSGYKRFEFYWLRYLLRNRL